jgi:hypothetical protein
MLKLQAEEKLFRCVVWGLTATLVLAIVGWSASLIAAVSCWSVTSLGTPRFACSLDLILFAGVELVAIAALTWAYKGYSFASSFPLIVINALVFLISIWISIAIGTGAIIGHLSW